MPVMNGETIIKQEEMTPMEGKDPRSGSDLGPGTPLTFCGGCGLRIFDRFYLVAVEQAWHNECLRCCECSRPLDTALSCFSRQARIYCREDYYRLFGVRRCNRCCLPLDSNELVMRARDAVFHLACFTCAACNQPLAKGDIFGMRDAVIYCRLHYEMLQNNENQNLGEMHQCDMSPHHQTGLLPGPINFPPIPPDPAGPAHMISMMDCSDFRGSGIPGYGAPTPPGFNPGIPDFQRCSGFFPGVGGVIPSPQKGRPRKRKIQQPQSSSGSNHDSPSVTGSAALRSLNTGLDLMVGTDLSSMDGMVYDSSGGSGGPNGQQQRTKRMRTSFKHHQLRTMKSYFAINQNPDAKDLKQLAQKTGLSKRVLQVWFQNARAKWRRNMMRQQDGNGGSTGSSSGPIKEGHGDLGVMTSSSAQSSSSALGELTPPGSAGLHSTLANDETNNSNLVFSDLYSV